MLGGDLEAWLKESKLRMESDELSYAEALAQRAFRYLQNRMDASDYEQALEQNLPIGLRLIESGHKHVLQARMKIPSSLKNGE